MIINTLRLIRLKDWLKNSIIFLPVIFSGNLLNSYLYIDLFFSFLIFSLTSSIIYIINDLNDLEDDKNHKIKKYKKPLASGDLSRKYAYFLLVSISLLTIILFFLNSNSIHNHIFLYLIINLSYSTFFKKIPFFEIFLICVGYLIRLDLGSYVIGVETSFLLSACIFSLSSFVISIKRLLEINNQNTNRKKIKFYSSLTIQVITVCSAISFLIFSLLFFIISNKILILIFPFLIFIFYRYFKTAINLNMGEFPIELILKDKILMLSSFLVIIFTIYLYI